LTAATLILAILAGAWLVRTHPYWLFGLAFGGSVLVLLVWIVVSALHPAIADRTCPRCSSKGLVRTSPSSTRGVRCQACGFEDLSSSSFVLAEEEGVALELLLLDERFRHGTANGLESRLGARPGGPLDDSSGGNPSATMEGPWPARE
jgi:hypothetical protein